jgi:hypothetical protein
MYFPLICTWIVKAGSTVGNDSCAIDTVLEGILELSVRDDERVSFSIWTIGVRDNDVLI